MSYVEELNEIEGLEEKIKSNNKIISKRYSEYFQNQDEEYKRVEEGLDTYKKERELLAQKYNDLSKKYYLIKFDEFVLEVYQLLIGTEHHINYYAGLKGYFQDNITKEQLKQKYSDDLANVIFALYGHRGNDKIDINFIISTSLDEKMPNGTTIFDNLEINDKYDAKSLSGFADITLNSCGELYIPIPIESLRYEGTFNYNGKFSVTNKPFDLYYQAVKKCLENEYEQEEGYQRIHRQ